MATVPTTVLSFLNVPRSQRQALGKVCGWLFGFWAAAASAQASPLLRCDVTYAGHTQVLTARPVSDPYPVEAVAIGGRFFFKMVMVGRADRIDHILIYAYLDQEPRPVIVQQSKYLAPFRATAQPYVLTGEQHVYAGPVERELIYTCWLGGVRP
jgi:hypothetical protein